MALHGRNHRQSTFQRQAIHPSIGKFGLSALDRQQTLLGAATREILFIAGQHDDFVIGMAGDAVKGFVESCHQALGERILAVPVGHGDEHHAIGIGLQADHFRDHGFVARRRERNLIELVFVW